MESRNEEVESEEQLEIKRLKEENRSLREKISASTETFKEEEKVKHYTGLSYGILMSLYDYLEPHIPYTSRSALTKFQKLILVLMKLKPNLGIHNLGYRFKVTPSCISKTFLDSIHVMYIRLKCLILWPAREELDNVYANGISQTLWCQSLHHYRLLRNIHCKTI